MTDRVDILIATYNGAAFLEEQIGSILAQSYEHWKLIIRDDGSTDGTQEIIERCAGKHPEKMQWVRDDRRNVGAAANFSILMEHSNAPYILFSDQDDIWKRDKVEVLLKSIRELEAGDQSTPAFVFSDLTKINDNGVIIAESLWKDEGLDPRRTQLNQLLVQNVPYGCASAINRSLLELARPVDERALLHDHWMVLLAASSGKVGFEPASTIFHRIHDANASRSRNPIRLERQKNAGAVLANRNFNRYFGQLQDQALAVKERLLERRISNDACEVLDDFINLRQKGVLARKRLMIKRRFFKHSAVQTLKWLVRI